MTSLDSALEEIAERGLLLNNLFQIDTAYWQANLRTANDQWITGYGRGLTALSALESALEQIAYKIDKPAVIATTEPPRSILADLGIEYKFHRRI